MKLIRRYFRLPWYVHAIIQFHLLLVVLITGYAMLVRTARADVELLLSRGLVVDEYNLEHIADDVHVRQIELDGSFWAIVNFAAIAGNTGRVRFDFRWHFRTRGVTVSMSRDGRVIASAHLLTRPVDGISPGRDYKIRSESAANRESESMPQTPGPASGEDAKKIPPAPTGQSATDRR